MKDSADIRKVNTYKIQKLFWSGSAYTKQQVAAKTGLSQATCNTLLNELERCGAVIGSKKRLQEVGRGSVCYRINEEHERFLCLYFEMLQNKKTLVLCLLSPTGSILQKTERQYDRLDPAVIATELGAMLAQHRNVTQIMIGTPSIAEDGIIRHCDIPELEEAALADALEQQFHLPVHMENDMHFKVYGYFCKCGTAERVITLANFPSHILPGTATIHDGRVIRGKNQFAGMVGFLPYDVDRAKELECLEPGACRPFVSKAMVSIIAIVNPGVIVLTGDLLDAESLAWIKEDCLQYIPKEYLPTFVYESDLNRYYIEGMYQKALALKEPASSNAKE